MNVSRRLAPLLVLPACAGAAVAPSPGPAPAPTVVASASAPSASVAASPPPPPTSPLHVAATGDRDLVLSTLAGRTFVHEPMLNAKAGFIGEIVDGRVAYDPAHAIVDGIGDFISGVHLAGTWPGNAFLTGTGMHSRTGAVAMLFRWDTDRWTSIGGEEGNVYTLSAWSGGRVLAMGSFGYGQNSLPYHMEFRVAGARTSGAMPQPRKGKEAWCQAETHAHAFTALASGHVFVLGDLCGVSEDDDGWNARVERWAPNQTKSHVDVLPKPAVGTQLTEKALWGRSPSFVVVGGDVKGGKPYLAKFDGAAWATMVAPESDLLNLVSLAGTDDGALYLVLSSTDDAGTGSRGELWHRSLSGAWDQVPLPPVEGKPLMPSQVWVPDGAGDLWVSAVGGDPKSPSVLLHSGPDTGVFKLPTLDEVADAKSRLRLAGPYEGSCETPFALLLTLSKSTPASFDFPALRAALKGHVEYAKATFVDFALGKERYLGASVVDARMGKKLVALVKSKIPEATARLVCHDPEPTRTLAIDLATGALK